MRPGSIVNFERFYLAAIALGLVNTFLSWDSAVASIRTGSPPGFQFGAGFLWGAVIIGFAIQLLLWYRTARRASVVAKWIIVVFFGFTLLSLLTSLTNGSVTRGLISPLAFGLNILATLLEGTAIWMLFRPDANRWFSGKNADQADIFS